MFAENRRAPGRGRMVAGLIASVLAGSQLLLATPAQAQQTEQPQVRPPEARDAPDKKNQKWSTLVGAVIDSINFMPLAGATVLLDGTVLSATTDSGGKFRIDSIPPGDYRIAIFHPLLDTLGFSIGTRPLRMGPDSLRTVLIGTPSAQGIVTRACPEAKRRLGEAAIMGRVLDPDTDVPLAGVRVTIAWAYLEVGNGLKRNNQMRETITDSAGNFVLCGVSPDMYGTLQAERGQSKTGEVEIEFLGGRLLAFQDLRMLDIPPSDSAPSAGNAVLSGRVVNKDGAPVRDATVTVQGSPITTTTDRDGRFRLTGLPSGTRTVQIRGIGLALRQMTVNLSVATPAEVSVSMREIPPELATVTVEGKYEAALKKNGFIERKRMGMGGTFFDAKAIQRRQPQLLSSLFQTIPGFTVESGFGGNTIKSRRSSTGCVTVWVDGIQYRENQAGELDNQIMPDQLMAIEAYSPVTAPSEFKTAGQTDCSVVVIWTNRTVR